MIKFFKIGSEIVELDIDREITARELLEIVGEKPEGFVIVVDGEEISDLDTIINPAVKDA